MNRAIEKQNIYIFLLILFFINTGIHSQVIEKTLKKHVKKLSSKEFEGRGVNTNGIKLAENYIIAQIESAKLAPINNSFRQEFTITTNETIKTSNILAMIPGSNEDSTLVVSAHYDHIGYRYGKLNPGANDNASGVAALLEIAKELNLQSIPPTHNILFAFFSGEESGLLGSRYFVSNSPYPINNTIANINLDMIGNTDLFHAKDASFIYAYGPKQTSSFLMQKIDSINNRHNIINLDFFEHDSIMGKKFLRMSDQANFIKHDIPALFIFNGLSPNYHTPNDTYKKLDYTKMKNVCNLTIELIKDLAY